jgi:hypothetical protein
MMEESVIVQRVKILTEPQLLYVGGYVVNLAEVRYAIPHKIGDKQFLEFHFIGGSELSLYGENAKEADALLKARCVKYGGVQ